MTEQEQIDRQRAQWRKAAAKRRAAAQPKLDRRRNTTDPMYLAGWKLNHLGFWVKR